MGWTFRKRVKIIPGVHLNLSKSGISTTIGVKGASINIGKKGTYLNTGIPGTGISHRQKISGGKGSNSNVIPETVDEFEPQDNIVSSDVQEITSQNMEGVKEAILLAHQQRVDLKKDITNVKAVLGKTKTKLTLSYIFLYGFINKNKTAEIKEDINNQKATIIELEEEVEKSYVSLDIEFSDEMETEYIELIDSFNLLSQSEKIWDVTGAYQEDTRKTRSAAGTSIKKNDTSVGLTQLPDIKSKYEAMYFNNLNGPDVYIYPNFVIMYENEGKFAVIDYDELDIYFRKTRFIETGKIPQDSKIIDKTWAKVNKNGTPDKRFKGNYEIPIVAYGDIIMRTNTGMNENWQFSNYESFAEFGERFVNYRKTINSITK